MINEEKVLWWWFLDSFGHDWLSGLLWGRFAAASDVQSLVSLFAISSMKWMTAWFTWLCWVCLKLIWFVIEVTRAYLGVECPGRITGLACHSCVCYFGLSFGSLARPCWGIQSWWHRPTGLAVWSARVFQMHKVPLRATWRISIRQMTQPYQESALTSRSLGAYPGVVQGSHARYQSMRSWWQGHLGFLRWGGAPTFHSSQVVQI